MSSNLYFSTLMLLGAITLYGLVHSWLASLQAKALARRIFGRAAERFYRLAYNIFAVVSFLPVLALLAAMPGKTLYAVPWPIALVPLAVQGLAAIMLLIGVLQTGLASFLGLAQIFQQEDDEAPARLVTGGLYRWVRHPLYVAGLIFLWLTPVMTSGLLVFNLGLTAYIVIGAKFEERKLLRAFGPAYRDYQQRTPMLW